MVLTFQSQDEILCLLFCYVRNFYHKNVQAEKGQNLKSTLRNLLEKSVYFFDLFYKLEGHIVSVLNEHELENNNMYTVIAILTY